MRPGSPAAARPAPHPPPHGYGPAGVWCWIEDDQGLRFGLWYGELFAAILGLLAANFYIHSTIVRRTKQWQGTFNPAIEAEKEFFKEMVQPIRLYPLVYLALSIVPAVNRIQNALDPDDPIFALYLVHALCTPLLGFANAVVFARASGEQFGVNALRRAWLARRLGPGVAEFDIATRSSDMVPLEGDSDDDAIAAEGRGYSYT